MNLSLAELVTIIAVCCTAAVSFGVLVSLVHTMKEVFLEVKDALKDIEIRLDDHERQLLRHNPKWSPRSKSD